MSSRLCCAVAALLLSCGLAAPLSAQTPPDKIFRHGIDGRPLSGQFVINGFPMPFPSGSFVDGAQQASPATYGGRFYWPPSTVQSNVNGLGLVTLNTQLFHRGTTSNPLSLPNTASVQLTQVYLQLYSATVSGTPVPLGNDCIYGPMVFNAQGTWNTSTASMSGSNIVIPPVAAGTCSGFSSTLNNSIAGSNNTVTINVGL